MFFKQLLYFTTVAETLNISVAARKLFISQPPISRQIMLLEKRLGVQLFVRKNKGLELTKPGLILYQQSKGLFSNLDDIIASVKAESKSYRGTIRIGALPSCMPFVIKTIKSYKARYSEVDLSLRTDTPSVLLEELEKGNIDIVFLRSFIQKRTDFTEIEVARDSLQLLMHHSLDPAPRQSNINYTELKKLPFCTLMPKDTWKYNEILLDECHRRKIKPHVLFECNDTTSMMQLIHNAMAVAFLPRPLLDTVSEHIKIIGKPVEGLNLTVPLNMVYNKDTYQTTCVRLFLNMIKSTLSKPTLNDQNFE